MYFFEFLSIFVITENQVTYWFHDFFHSEFVGFFLLTMGCIFLVYFYFYVFNDFLRLDAGHGNILLLDD